MDLEQQVCSLCLAQRLKALGVPQDGFCFWLGPPSWPYDLWNQTQIDERATFSFPQRALWIAAFTVAELGLLLPRESYTLRTAGGWRAALPSRAITCCAGTEADARALLLLWCLEQGLVEVGPGRGETP